MDVLNRFRRRKETDRAKEDSPSPSKSSDGSEAAEGFLCPACMAAFLTAEILQTHYTTHHEKPASETRDNDYISLKMEVDDLQSSLKEERWYAQELKKELDIFQAGKKEFDVDDKIVGERELIKQQLKALEESKALLSSEVMLLRKQLTESLETNIAFKQDKEKLEQRAAKVAGDLVSIKAQLDEECGQKAALEEHLKTLSDHAVHIEHQLKQRPAADDVVVLRQELVSVQTLMDQMARDQELERDKLQQEFEALQLNFQHEQAKIIELEDKLRKAPKQEEIESLRAILNERATGSQEVEETLQQRMQENLELQNKLKTIESELLIKSQEINSQMAQISQFEEQIKMYDYKVVEMGQEFHISQEQLRQSQENMERTEAKLQESEKQMENLASQLSENKQNSQGQLYERYQLEMELKNQLDKSLAVVTEKSSEINDLNKQLNSLQIHFQEQSVYNDELQSQLWEKNSQLEEELRLNKLRESKVQEMETLISQNKEEIIRMENERTDLIAKIEAGEGASTVINQLKQENQSLQEKLTESHSALEKQAKETNYKMEELHKQLLEAKSHLKNSQDKSAKLSENLKEQNSKHIASQERIAQLETDVKAKNDLLLAAEASKTAQRTDLENHIKTAQLVVEEKTKELEKLKHQLNQLSDDLSVKKEQHTRLEVNLKEHLDKYNQSQQRHVALESSLKEKEKSLEQINKEKMILQQQLTEANSSFSMATKDLDSIKKQFQENESTWKDCKEQLIVEHKQQVNSLREKIQNLKNSLEQEQLSHAEKVKHEAVLCSKVEDLRKMQTEIEEKMKEQESRLTVQDATVQKMADEISELKTQLDKKEKCNIDVIKQNTSLQTEQIKCQEQMKTLEESVNKHQAELQESENLLQKVTSELVDIKTQFSGLQKEHEGTLTLLHKMEDSEKLLKISLSELSKIKTHLEQRIEKLAAELEDVRQRYQAIVEEKIILENTLQERDIKISELQDVIIETKKIAAEIRLSSDKEKEEKIREITTLQDAKQLLINQKLELQSSLNRLQEQLQQAHSEHKKLKEVFGVVEDTLKQEKTELGEKLSISVRLKNELHHEKEQNEARYEMQLSALNENISTLRSDLVSNQYKIDELEKTIDELRGAKLELDAKLENAQDDRRALLERCLMSESDVEKLRGNVSELRRKLEDATAAMHELGRENQSLQIENSKHINRKWTDDAVALHCSLCAKAFSVTIRKHHCRNCGNIFCNDCSSKNAPTASSKKPVRVCNTCFFEITNDITGRRAATWSSIS